MKSLIAIVGIFVLVAFASTTFGEVKIKEAPLTWQQAALTDGEELYQELCAACHGVGGKGDGPAASALVKPVSDLTVLTANNDGVFPQKQVEDSITGKSRVVAHGTVDMPVWGQRFEELRPDWKQYRRKALARQRIYNMTLHIESLQAE
jgi:mono/diheme cytochrome c family protein